MGTTDSAINYGSLNYALSVDAGAVFAIGNIVTATITPVSSGLVKATILSCEVTNSDLSSDNEVSIIDANLKPTCDLGVAITTGQGDSTLGFTWQSFKWSTAKVVNSDVVENQELACSISLAKTPATVTPQACGSQAVEQWSKTERRACEGNHYEVSASTVTEDECKTQCLQESDCVAVVSFNVVDSSAPKCYKYAEGQCDNPMSLPSGAVFVKNY